MIAHIYANTDEVDDVTGGYANDENGMTVATYNTGREVTSAAHANPSATLRFVPAG